MMQIFQNGLCVEFVDNDMEVDFAEPTPAPKAHPQLPVEVWNPAPISGADCIAATRAMCEGNSR